MGRGQAVSGGSHAAAAGPHDLPNRVLFREVNEQLRSREQRPAPPGSLMTIVCECDRRHCFRHLQIPVEQYDRIRDSAAWFVVSAGHGVDAEEMIVEAANDFLVVEQAAAGPIASRLDPASARRASPAAAEESAAQ